MSPKSGDTGEFTFTTGLGYITSMDLPGGEANQGGPIVLEATMRFPSVTKAVAA